MKNDIKVARIVDDFTVVINAGTVDGISQGNVVMVYDIDGTVKDPDTGETLGELEIVKGTGVVTNAQERFSTVVSNMDDDAPIKVMKKNHPSEMARLARSFGYSTVEQIPVKKKKFENPKVGSLVKLLRL